MRFVQIIGADLGAGGSTKDGDARIPKVWSSEGERRRRHCILQ